MTFGYTVTVNDPSNSPLDAALAADVRAAAAQWSRFIYGSGSIDITVSVETTTRASGGPSTLMPAGTDGSRKVYQPGTNYELLTGKDPNGTGSDVTISVDPAYLGSLWLDPGSVAPADKTDGLSVFMHEIGHALGVISARSASTGLLGSYELTWDRLLTVDASNNVFFVGTNAKAIHGGAVPVTTLQNGEQYSHLGNSINEASGQDLMNGVSFRYGTRYGISDLDLAIMKDLGLNVVSGANGDPLLDPFFYMKQYADASAAHVDAAAHYNQFGWHENRDPSAFFSTVGYLAANQDVARAAVNPLQHFEVSGWKEGRDASLGFDNELYLAHNPDVKAAGVNPLFHYLLSGRFEGRQAYTAIGDAGSFNHASFDAEYYLLANPDVARVALSSAVDTRAFAYAHYNSLGWQEGRNPNSVFDVKAYLAAYGDVRAAKVDPLLHYDQFGWKEGRDPSAGFDTKAYLSHYADVAAAHSDPLQHYLQFGAIEGRSTFADGHF